MCASNGTYSLGLPYVTLVMEPKLPVNCHYVSFISLRSIQQNVNERHFSLNLLACRCVCVCVYVLCLVHRKSNNKTTITNHINVRVKRTTTIGRRYDTNSWLNPESNWKQISKNHIDPSLCPLRVILDEILGFVPRKFPFNEIWNLIHRKSP